MYIECNSEFIKMMNGGFGEFSAYEVWFIITNMNQLGINTLRTQQNFDGFYYCTVDERTTRAYRDKRRSLD